MSNVYFTADLHLGHKNILKHQPNRINFMGLKDVNDIEGHDKYIYDMWHSITKRGDIVYILGDLTLMPTEGTRKALIELKKHGCKINLIVGNHDHSVLGFPEMFETMSLLKLYKFKPTAFPFLDDTFRCVMCHYPMLSWADKSHGSVCLHGHTHNNSPWENQGIDLRLNVGIDTEIAQGKLVSLEQVYDWYKKKLNGLTPDEYIEKCTAEYKDFIR